MVLNYKKFNPLAFYLLRFLRDTSIRFLTLYGGSSSGKTFSVAQIILIMTMWEGSNTLVLRKVATSIKDTIYQSFRTAVGTLGVTGHFKFSDGLKIITCLDNGARIVFKGLDDQEKIKGLESFKRIIMEELSEFDEQDHKQIRKRLRGMPGQQIVHMFNPINEGHWIKRKLFDTNKWRDIPMEVEIGGKVLPRELTAVKSIRMNESRTSVNPNTGVLEMRPPNTVVIQTTYLNNFWVVGSPDGTYGFYDHQCVADFEYDREHDPDYYNVYALGEWGVIRTGSEFFGSFNRGKHTAAAKHDPELPVHLSIDSNVMPYISVSYWQVHTDDGVRIEQIDETCAGSPDNSARKSAKLVADKLRGMGVGKVYLHGDASTRAANTIDDDKRSFLDLFISTLRAEGVEVVDCVRNKNPNVAMTGEFINAILEGMFEDMSIIIGERCVVSIEDYMSVQKDVNGAILKTKVKNKVTGQTYEEHGHLSDTFRYLVADVLNEEFITFSSRRKRNLYARDGVINFYNPETECRYTGDICYLLPNIKGKFSMLHGKLCGEKWHIVSAKLVETDSVTDITEFLTAAGASTTVVECKRSYFPFVRELRGKLPEVRAKLEEDDLGRRAAATSHHVRDRILFNPDGADNDPHYSAFISSLLDYGRDPEAIEASAALSGFIQYALKWLSNGGGH